MASASSPVVVVPVAPGAEEGARTADLLASLRAHEPRVHAVVLVDDEPARARLDAHRGPGVEVIPNPRGGRGIGTLGGTCSATLAGLAWVHRHAPGAWCLRLDTDALVIGPFAQALADAFDRNPDAGVLGSCERTCNGEPRDLTPWAATVRRHARPVWVWRRPPRRGRHVQLALAGRNGAVRRELRTALASGYRPGEHCLAAACAISSTMIERMAGAGMLSDPVRWLNTRCGDDIMLGIQARALGLCLVGLVGEGEPFGLRHVGLPDTPARLAQRGFSFIHSVKNDSRIDEAEIRRFFAARR